MDFARGIVSSVLSFGFLLFRPDTAIRCVLASVIGVCLILNCFGARTETRCGL